MTKAQLDQIEKRWTELGVSLATAQNAMQAIIQRGVAAPTEQVDVASALRTSGLALPGYATLDGTMIEEIQSKIRRIVNYIADPASHRPLTFILTAEPGNGKSYFVKCLAKECGIPMVTANVASLERISELGFWIDEIRDHKTEDKTPILLIDEADSKPQEIPAFLPLLWDGLFSWQGRNLKIGKCVIVLVASNESLRRYVEDGTKDQNIQGFPKIEDLLSRINGGVMRLSPIDQRLLDKLCIVLTQIRLRFPNVNGVQLPFLKLLVNTRFLHSVRSMEALIEYFPTPGADGILRVTQEFDSLLQDRFLKRETFRANVFAFHLGASERVNAQQTWFDHRESQTIVAF